jgi:hypothetical protein
MKTPTPAGNVRPLPVMVQPLPAETITGFLGRLATANALTPRELRLHVTDLAGLSPSHPNLERAAKWAERLGGLKPGHFENDARKNAMYVRCQHYAWQPTLCKRCGYAQAARNACRRCARGEQTLVQSRGGAVCNRHRRWHLDGADVDLAGSRSSPMPSVACRARCGSAASDSPPASCNWPLLVRYWSIEERLDGRIADRMATIGINSLDADSVFLAAYPEIVRLTTILTDLSFASYLLSPRFSLAEQVWALEAAVVTVMSGCTTSRLHQIAEQIVARGKMAVETAFGMRQNASNNRPATLEKSLVASSQRHRSCLLRHLSTVRIQILPYEPGFAVPSNRVLGRRKPLPDLVDA